jgi:serine/threonine-protein kinase HipA
MGTGKEYISRRMDRVEGCKLHMEDMCQLTDRLTDEKYRGSMEQVGKTVLRYGSNPLLDAVRLFERMIFCHLTGNADMHLKNFSLLHLTDGEVVLSPAYDLLPTSLLIPADTEESTLTINGRKKKLKREDFLRCGASWKLTARQMENVFERFSAKMNDVIAFIDRGFSSQAGKENFQTLMRNRASSLGLVTRAFRRSNPGS